MVFKKISSLLIVTTAFLVSGCHFIPEHDCVDNNINCQCDICGAFMEFTPNWEPQMPTLTIQTENNQAIKSKTNYVACTIALSNCTIESYNFNALSAGIRGRGNSTWGQRKNPYRIKFDSKQKMFGRKKQKSWTLLANYFDYSLVRNYFFYKLSSKLNDTPFSSLAEFVEVYLNGVYEGVYLVADQIQTGENRIEIDEDLYEDGEVGFLVEINERIKKEKGTKKGVDYVVGNNDLVYEIKTPDVENKTFLENPKKYTNYILNVLNTNYNNLKSHVSWETITEKMDVNSFADGYLLEELGKNTDAMTFSTYLYQDRGGKLSFGPVWDFDIGAGNSNYGPGNKYTCSPQGIYVGQKNWCKHLLEYDEFKQIVAQKLHDYQDVFFELLAELDVNAPGSLYDKYGETFERNFVRFDNVMGRYTFSQPKDILKLKTNKDNITFLKNWLTARNEFLLETYKISE